MGRVTWILYDIGQLDNFPLAHVGFELLRMSDLHTREPQPISRRDVLRARPASHPEGQEYWIRVHRRAMACRFEVTLSGEDASSVGAAQQALAEAARLEERLSVFRETSELTA